MNRSGLFITFIMGCLAALLWMLVNSPDIEPPWPKMVQGFSFSPYRTGQSAELNVFPTEAEIEEDLALLAGDTHAVRSYSVKGTLAEIPRLATSKGLNVVLGAWISNIAKDNEEAWRLSSLAPQPPVHSSPHAERLSSGSTPNHSRS